MVSCACLLYTSIVERDHQALEDVRAFLGLRQLVARPAHDDVFLVRDVVVQHLLDERGLGQLERQHDGALLALASVERRVAPCLLYTSRCV